MSTMQQDPSARLREPQYMTPETGENADATRQPPELVVREEGGTNVEQRAKGVKNIVSGAVLIGIGFAFGGSVYLGNPGMLDWVFDGLGTFWVCKGLYEAVTA